MAETSSRRVLIFGRTGAGKSTMANMLISGGLLRNPVFAIGDGMHGVTCKLATEEGLGYRVTDTVGLGEETESERKDAKGLIIEFLKKTRGTYHHILFAKEATLTRVDTLDTILWKTFLEIFQEEKHEHQHENVYQGMAVVLTKCKKGDKWLEENRTELEKHYKEVNGRFIAVDFPEIDDDEEIEALLSRKRDVQVGILKKSLDDYYRRNGENCVFTPRFSKMEDAKLQKFAAKIYNLLNSKTLAAAAGMPILFLFQAVFRKEFWNMISA